MHHIYTTDSLILRRLPEDTSASYLILTKDLGLIRARAQGVRKHESKLKPALQEYCQSHVSFVRGKHGWRVTNAIPIRNLYIECGNDHAKQVIAQICLTLVRLVQGEHIDSVLFEISLSGFKKILSVSDDLISNIEVLILLRILFVLGYVATGANISKAIESMTDYSQSTMSFVQKNKSKIISVINKGLNESQL
jgi:recombinational DNA repair protein (RecF pathway)